MYLLKTDTFSSPVTFSQSIALGSNLWPLLPPLFNESSDAAAAEDAPAPVPAPSVDEAAAPYNEEASPRRSACSCISGSADMSEESAAAVAESMAPPPNKLEDAKEESRLRDNEEEERDVEEEEEEVVVRRPNEDDKEEPAVEEISPAK